MKRFAMAALLLCFVSPIYSASRSDSVARVGMAGRGAGTRNAMQPAAAPTEGSTETTVAADAGKRTGANPAGAPMQSKNPAATPASKTSESSESSGSCRENYRGCMNEFCQLDESEGGLCACSETINTFKTKIKEISDIQAEADKLFGEGVEREKLGAKAVMVFGDNTKNKNVNLLAWLNSDQEEEETDIDWEIGDALYDMAKTSCKEKLDACGKDATMEEMLYGRAITADCKTFNSFLDGQKKTAQSNKLVAEKAVRTARLDMLDTTNKYNRGECLIAYKGCIADKGGCGANFENCLDASLLARRANACDNILDQCMAVKNYVKKDWDEESKSVLAEAAKFADTNKRGTCLARIEACLEDGCAKDTSATCLNNVDVAAGICPVITECEEMIPGIRDEVNKKLTFLRVRFCQNDLDACLKEKCGANFTAAACVGKGTDEIAKMCPQKMFPSCTGQRQYDAILSAALLQVDYQLMQGCVNHFSEQLGRVCGTDMACLPPDQKIQNMASTEDVVDWRKAADAAVNDFFKQFEKDQTIKACATSTGSTLGSSVFATAKLLAKQNAENHYAKAYQKRIAELASKESAAEAKKVCEENFKPEQGGENTMWIKSVMFNESNRMCHICRMQKVCGTFGQGALEAASANAAGGAASGAGMGMSAGPWGAAIGGAVGLLGSAVSGMKNADREKVCSEFESCEDVQM